MFQSTKGYFGEYDRHLPTARSTVNYVLLIKLNFTSGNSLCCLCCWNVFVIVPEDGLLRAETCRSGTIVNKVALIINVCISQFFNVK